MRGMAWSKAPDITDVAKAPVKLRASESKKKGSGVLPTLFSPGTSIVAASSFKISQSIPQWTTTPQEWTIS
jgi:hypothetical protein